MTKQAQPTKIKQRYLSAKNEGQEFYVENIPTAPRTALEEAISGWAKVRLQAFRTAMPKGDITLTIEEQTQDGSWAVIDVATGLPWTR